MTLPTNDYAPIKDLIASLLAERQANPQMKLAFVFEGGGAKGCYQAGLLEGIAQILHDAGSDLATLRPDILAGTSVGSIVAYALWTELMYPGPSATQQVPSPNPYALRQSALWRNLADGFTPRGGGATVPPNQGAEQVLNPGRLIDWATGQRPIPFVSQLAADINKLTTDWQSLLADFDSLQTNAGKLGHDLTDLVGEGTAIEGVGATLTTAGVANVITFLGAVGTALGSPGGVAAASAAASSALAGLAAADFAALVSALSTITATATRMRATVTAIRTDAAAIATNAGALSSDVGSLGTDATNFAADLDRVTLQVEALLEQLSFLFVARSAGVGVPQPAPNTPAGVLLATNVLSDHLLDTSGLRRTLKTFLSDSPGVPADEAGVRHDWYHRNLTQPAGSRPPELYLTGASLTTSRMLVFAMAPVATIQAVADDATPVVDLSGSTRSLGPAPSFVSYPSPDMPAPLIESVMASAALPIAFPPITWAVTPSGHQWFHQPTPPSSLSEHTVVDGGVFDDTPLDVAIKAGATHVVTFELDGILNYDSPPPFQASANASWPMVFYNSFSALRARVTATRIMEQMATNQATENAGGTPVPIYRIGPIPQQFAVVLPGPRTRGAGTPGVVTLSDYSFLDFNGHWLPSPDASKPGTLLINLEDRFMQGYQDARLLVPDTRIIQPGLIPPSLANQLPAGSQPVAPDLTGSLTTQDVVYGEYLNRATVVPNNIAPTGRVSFVKANKAYVAITQPFPSHPL